MHHTKLVLNQHTQREREREVQKYQVIPKSNVKKEIIKCVHISKNIKKVIADTEKDDKPI